jgi:hypothetical protein
VSSQDFSTVSCREVFPETPDPGRTPEALECLKSAILTDLRIALAELLGKSLAWPMRFRRVRLSNLSFCRDGSRVLADHRDGAAASR